MTPPTLPYEPPPRGASDLNPARAYEATRPLRAAAHRLAERIENDPRCRTRMSRERRDRLELRLNALDVTNPEAWVSKALDYLDANPGDDWAVKARLALLSFPDAVSPSPENDRLLAAVEKANAS